MTEQLRPLNTSERIELYTRTLADARSLAYNKYAQDIIKNHMVEQIQQEIPYMSEVKDDSVKTMISLLADYRKL